MAKRGHASDETWTRHHELHPYHLPPWLLYFNGDVVANHTDPSRIAAKRVLINKFCTMTTSECWSVALRMWQIDKTTGAMAALIMQLKWPKCNSNAN